MRLSLAPPGTGNMALASATTTGHKNSDFFLRSCEKKIPDSMAWTTRDNSTVPTGTGCCITGHASNDHRLGGNRARVAFQPATGSTMVRKPFLDKTVRRQAAPPHPTVRSKSGHRRTAHRGNHGAAVAMASESLSLHTGETYLKSGWMWIFFFAEDFFSRFFGLSDFGRMTTATACGISRVARHCDRCRSGRVGSTRSCCDRGRKAINAID